MSTYVMSDIHGCYYEFKEMLRKICFSDSDTLVLAGDYIDRGNQNVEMLEYVSYPPSNVILLKGNHDQEFVRYIGLLDLVKMKYLDNYPDFSLECTKAALELVDEAADKAGTVDDYYGTVHDLILKDNVTLDALLVWSLALDSLPYVYKSNVNGSEIIIVHAGYTEDSSLLGDKSFEHFYLYARDEALIYGGKENAIIVAGHTPTIIPTEKVYNDGNIFRWHKSETNTTFYCIDCGVAYKKVFSNAKLACLRLDDFKEYYV